MLTQSRWLAPMPAGCVRVQTPAPFDRGRVPDQWRDVPAHQREALPSPDDTFKDQRTGRGTRRQSEEDCSAVAVRSVSVVRAISGQRTGRGAWPQREENFSAIASRHVSIVRAISREPGWDGLAGQHHGDSRYLKRPPVTEP